MAHNCKTLVISCIDFRFQTVIRNYLVENGLEGNYDLIAFPGASLAWADIKNAAGISFRLHQPQEVLLIDHEDCGAYGADNSLDTHQANLEKAKAEILLLKSEVKVKKMMAYFDKVQEV